MQILFHSDSIFGRSSYGLTRYSRELWRALTRCSRRIRLRAYGPRGAHYAAQGGGVPGPDPVNGSARSRWLGRMEIASWAAFGYPFIERMLPQTDVVHSVELDYPVATCRPWVVTIHDLGPLTHPQFFSRSNPWLRRRALDQAVARADAIVCVSAATAAAVRELAREPIGDRLRIVHEGVGEEFFQPPPPSQRPGVGLPSPGTPYFLWTGSLNPRKNLANVVRAFDLAAPRLPHHLVLAGGLGWDSEDTIGAVKDAAARARIHRPGYVTDGTLRTLYSGATAFVYVSLLEGFGLPILEAMASGCPVVTSNISSMPEIAGSAALLVDPASPEEIAGAMLRIARDEALRQDLRTRGLSRAAQFSWQRCAEQMLAIYREIL